MVADLDMTANPSFNVSHLQYAEANTILSTKPNQSPWCGAALLEP